MHTDALIEEHPLRPFLPTNGRVLLLGSFPPPQARWSMRFFYPNFQNDMWRIMGLVFFGQRDHFVVPHRRQFNQPLVEAFCAQRGIALFDTATAVRRLRDNASDKHLEIVRPTDLAALLSPCRCATPWWPRASGRPSPCTSAMDAPCPAWEGMYQWR